MALSEFAVSVGDRFIVDDLNQFLRDCESTHLLDSEDWVCLILGDVFYAQVRFFQINLFFRNLLSWGCEFRLGPDPLGLFPDAKGVFIF